MMYDNNNNPITKQQEVYVTKKQAEALDLGFTKYSLKYGDIMLLLDIEDILEEYKQEQGTITNNVFDNIQCDKVGIVYSPKLKKFIYLAVNDNFTCYIIFQDILPNFEDINLEHLPVNAQIMDQANRRMSSVYKYIHDLTTNPIFQMTVNEVFKK